MTRTLTQDIKTKLDRTRQRLHPHNCKHAVTQRSMPKRRKMIRGDSRREPRCSICRLDSPDDKCLGACYRCYMHTLEMQLRAIPDYPAILARPTAAAVLAAAAEDSTRGCKFFVCQSCEIVWPAELGFRDSRGRSKCVLCRKFELINKVEITPGIMITFSLWAEGRRRIRCLGCQDASDQADFTIELGRGASWKAIPYRVSMFCGTCRCRGLEERLAVQGLVNTDS